MQQETIISVAFNGAKFQFGLTKKTTCNGIIKMAKIGSVLPTNDTHYGMYEKSFENVRLLSGNTKLLKQVRTWGVNRRDFELELKPVDNLKSKMASIARAKAKLTRLRSLITKNELKENEKLSKNLEDNITPNMDVNIDKQYEKNITLLDELPVSEVRNNRSLAEGKVEVMTRYLRGFESRDYYNDFSQISELERVRGDGCDDTDPSILTGINRIGSTAFGSLDMAFLSNTTYNENQSSTLDDLNECVLYDDLNECVLYDNSDSIVTDDESAFEDMSEYDSVCELELNVVEEDADTTIVKMDRIKAAFSKCDLNAKLSEDSMLESFMNTFVNTEDSDEGLSSGGSDFE